MLEKILLIDHHDNPRDDLATTHLKQLGYEIELCCPFLGDRLPASNSEFSGAVIYGGEQNVTELEVYPFLKDELIWIQRAVAEDFPTIGICLGAQLIAHVLGSQVDYHPDGLYEFGYYEITPSAQGKPILPHSMLVAQAHYQHYDLPPGAKRLASGKTFENQAYQYGENIFGLQFHPEITAPIFRRWQDSDWAFYGKPGAQTREQQDSLIDDADRVQGQWFRQFMESLFGIPQTTAVSKASQPR